MASTFSNLKFELIGTGDQSGTWGTTTNTNLGTAIEQALVGMATISSGFTGSPLTLSLTLTDTNAAQNARALCLNLTQALGSAGTLNVPAIQKPYMIINATGQTVTVKVTGLTGVAVPTGTRAFLYNNGTDVGDFFNYASSLTLGTDLAIADGGTGASDAPTARTNLGLGSIATQAANNVSITGGSITGITDLAVADGGTGASTACGARTNLGLGTIATQAANNVSITGGSITGITDLAVADGGTGASTACGARTNLGLGTIATQAASNVSITGGSITGITDLAVADGGTGASSAPAARTNLGATTVGSNFFTLTNPSAITFLRINADNTVSTLDAATFRTAIGAGTGGGSVSCVNTSGSVNGITLTGGPITSSGTVTLGGTLSGVNLSSGPTQQITGTLPIGNGGTGAICAPTALSNLGAYAASNPAGYAPGTVTSVATSGSINGLTLTGGPITTTGTVTLGGGVNVSTITTGTLPVLYGGTGATTAPGALTNLGAYAASNPAGYAPGTVTSVATSGSINGLTLTGGPITTTGTVTLGGGVNVSTITTGTLPVARGGTGLCVVGCSGNVLTSNGTAWVSQAAGGGANIQSFPASGTYTKPSGAKFVMVELWGAGGGGGGQSGSGQGGAGAPGAGGGGYTTKVFAAPEVGATETVTIGAGGTAGPSASPYVGTNGGSTNFGTLLYAYGGIRGNRTCGVGQGGSASFVTCQMLGANGFPVPAGNFGYAWSVMGGGLGYSGVLGIWAGGRGGSSGGVGAISVFGGGGGGGGQRLGGPACCNYPSPTPSPSSYATGGMGRLLGRGASQGPYGTAPFGGPASCWTVGIGGGGPIGAAGNAYNGGGGGPINPPYAGGAGGIAGGGGGGGGRPGFGGTSAGGAGGNGYAIVYTW